MNKIEQRMQMITGLLKTIEEGVGREGLVDTPNRVAKMYDEIFDGYSKDPIKILTDATFIEDGIVEDDIYQQGMVIVRNIEYFSHCEHHMVPFFGKAHVAYIPKKLGVGLSKIARVVEVFAHRLQVQERMTKQIADTIQEALDPVGVMVVVSGEHLCMKMRGIKNPCSDTITSAIRGWFEQQAPRQEFLSLVGKI